MAELNMNESHKVLESNGLYVDDLSRVRVVDPEIADASGKYPQEIVHLDMNFQSDIFSIKLKDEKSRRFRLTPIIKIIPRLQQTTLSPISKIL